MTQKSPVSIDEYIAAYPPEIQSILQEMRTTIREAAPQATEKISWGMATFFLHGNLVHFSAHKNHVGFYPAPSAIEAFRDDLAEYRFSKGGIQFPYAMPLPVELIQSIVRFRVAEQEAIAETPKVKPVAEKRKAPSRRPRHPIPEDVKAAITNQNLNTQYAARPAYQRNDYIGWIIQAKRQETRQKRLAQMLEELRQGNVYMGQPYQGKGK